MSTKLQLLSKNHLSTEHTVINNHQNFSSYEQEIEFNLRNIMKRYPHLDKNKVRNLLEELQNNFDLAVKILEEEEQDCNKILQEKRSDIKKPLNLSQDQENVILKRSFLNLYKQITFLKKQKEDLMKKNDALKSENQKLKLMTKYLLQKEYNSNELEEIRDIC